MLDNTHRREPFQVALRKESVDRNGAGNWPRGINLLSLSARRAWIEIILPPVDTSSVKLSLSARRAWIEMKSGLQPLIAS